MCLQAIILQIYKCNQEQWCGVIFLLLLNSILPQYQWYLIIVNLFLAYISNMALVR